MALGEKVKETLKDAFTSVADVLTMPIGLALEYGLDKILDLLGKRLAPKLQPLIKTLEDTGKVPPELAPLLEEMKNPSGEIGMILQYAAAQGGLGMVAGGVLATITSGLDLALKAVVQPSLLDIRSIIESERRKAVEKGFTDQEWLWTGFNTKRRDILREVSRPLLDINLLKELFLRYPSLRTAVDDYLRKIGLSESDIDWVKFTWPLLLDPNTLRQLYLRKEIDEPTHDFELKAHGFDDKQISDIKKLYQIIPGVGDLIRMAVREAFAPDVVAKFQTDADFPPEFADWAAKQGLSAEWAKNYWRAHWDLPSATQGFEMMHRGIIDKPELELLLRTLDVMPYWRDRLIQMTYSIPTRVDIRRIYNLGIRDRVWVKAQYIKLGYSGDDAEALTEFTTKLATSEDKDLTKADILSLFKKGVLDDDTTREYLIDLDYSEEDVDYLIAKAAAESTEATRELSLTHIKSLALAGIIDKTEATTKMADLGYTAEDIIKLYDLWTLDAPLQNALPSRTDLKNFYLAEIIDLDTWIDYMYKLRYPEEVIAWYYQQMTSEK